MHVEGADDAAVRHLLSEKTMQCSIKERILSGAFLLGTVFFFMNTVFAQATDCRKPKFKNDRLLCAAIVRDLQVEDSAMIEELSFVSRRADLDGDGRDEVFVWIPAWGGTGGYPIVLFSQKRHGYQKLWSEDAWTPVILLRSKSGGWQDFAYQVGGGGGAWQYVIVRHNGRSYRDHRVQEKQPEGKVLIEKNWSQTTFGPVPKHD